MSFRRLCKLFLVAGSILALASCDKDKDDTAAPSLNGLISFYVDPFVSPGEVRTIKPSGATHPKGKGVGYYWRVTPDPNMKKADTTRFENGLNHAGQESDGSFTYKFRDSLATYTVSCSAFAKGYSGLYASTYVTVVKPGLTGSLTSTGIKADDAKITVDGINYYYISHNGLDWMRNNLANPEFGAPYANSEAISEILGRYYSYEEAMKACPAGWRLPTDAEWRALAAGINGAEEAEAFGTISDIAADFMADAQFNLKKMWEYWPEVGDITNNSSLGMIPGGYANLGNCEDNKYPYASFKGIYEYATFWTSDIVEDEEGMAYYRYLICDQPEMYVSKGDMKSFGANVRCVRESK